MKRKKRVRLHLIDPHADAGLPSLEGLLVSKRASEYVLALPSMLVAVGAKPEELADARLLCIPRERVAFYEVLR